MIYALNRNDLGKPAIETFENDNVIITRFELTNEVDVRFKPNAAPMVKRIYRKLMKKGRQ